MSPSVVADYDTDDAELQGDLKAEVKGDVMIKISELQADTAKLKGAMGPLKLLTEAIAQLNEALKTKDAAISQLREIHEFLMNS